MSEGQENNAVIRTPDRRLRVFVSSTLGELAEERRAVARAISALRLTPVMFEQGARPHPPRDLYRAYLAQSDVFIGLYWQRYGQLAPGIPISGLEEEFELARSLPRLLYVKAPAPGREPRLTDLLTRIEEEALASYRTFRAPTELGRLVRDDLATLLSEQFAVSRTPAVAAPPPSPASARRPRPLPVSATSLIGRQQDIDKAAGLVQRKEARLLTLTGPGGVGKTRLALAIGERLRDLFDAGTVFVPLAEVTRPELVLAGISRAAGTTLAGTGSALDALADQLGDGRWLLILDNLEQVVNTARDLDDLLARCPGVTLLATSRTVLGLRAEREYPVPPLPLPAGPASVPVGGLVASPAMALFVDRARAVRPDFALTEGNAWAVAEICRRLEGLPLAIELAAARTRLLDPGALLDRLSGSLDALGTGTVDMPERQHTLRATVEWSVSLLDDAERSLLETVTVFVDGWTTKAAAQVAGLDEDRILDLTEALARHSLVQSASTELGPRSRMLETVRAFVAERLAARPDVAEVRRRHAGYYRALAEQADRPLRRLSWNGWAGRLQAEAGNLAAAVRWHLTHDPRALPHLFRVLLAFWALQDDLREANSWVNELLPTAESLDPQAQAELVWTAAVTAREVGDDESALAARARLEQLLDKVQDPYLHAVSRLAIAWTSAITGDSDSALRWASASLAELRGQDEPLWTTLALITAGSLETALGRHDDALRHLTEVRDRAERFDNAWLTAASRVQLGTLAVMRGRPEEARKLLDEGLDLSLAIHSTRNVTLSVAVYAQLAFEEGDTERAALLAGAAEGLRRRAGLRAWPAMRRDGTEPVALVRQALGADQFDQIFAAGTRLSQREAVAAVRDRHGTWAPRAAADTPARKAATLAM